MIRFIYKLYIYNYTLCSLLYMCNLLWKIGYCADIVSSGVWKIILLNRLRHMGNFVRWTLLISLLLVTKFIIIIVVTIGYHIRYLANIINIIISKSRLKNWGGQVGENLIIPYSQPTKYTQKIFFRDLYIYINLNKLYNMLFYFDLGKIS